MQYTYTQDSCIYKDQLIPGMVVRYSNGQTNYDVVFKTKGRKMTALKSRTSGCLFAPCNGVFILQEDFVSTERQETNSTKPVKENDMAKLYQWKVVRDNVSYTIYGTKLAVNSEGQAVMELKNTNKIMTVDQNQIEEVRPYTVSVGFIVGNSTSNYHYFVKKGLVSKGDILKIKILNEEALVVVTGVDTNSDSATKNLEITGRVPVVPV